MKVASRSPPPPSAALKRKFCCVHELHTETNAGSVRRRIFTMESEVCGRLKSSCKHSIAAVNTDTVLLLLPLVLLFPCSAASAEEKKGMSRVTIFKLKSLVSAVDTDGKVDRIQRRESKAAVVMGVLPLEPSRGSLSNREQTR